MSSQKTTNYDLNQWLPTDSVLRTDFNADNAKIDAALSAMSEQVVQKANQSALDTLISAVNQKAGQDDLTALEGTVAGHTAALTKLGNCEIDLFTYTGNGQYGPDNPTYISFSKAPTLFMIFGGNYSAFGSKSFNLLFLDLSTNNASAVTTWSGNRVAFTQGAASWQMNQSGTTYYVIALYDKNT